VEDEIYLIALFLPLP